MDTVKKLALTRDLDDHELSALISSGRYDGELRVEADAVRRKVYGDAVFIRGLVEFTNYCKNDCYYCGIRRGNAKADRFRLTPDEILSCCAEGHALGFRTFVLQGGEDPFFDDAVLCGIVSSIRESFPDCAVTLSVGERSRESYLQLYRAGAERYLLRHETADPAHYGKLHPQVMSSENRKKCLFDLKEIGYQVGSGFMVGSPYQTVENIVCDLRFLKELDPDMIGIGPFVTHSETPFANFESGSAELTLRLLSILRLMFPHALIPATTSLGTVSPTGREDGLRSGANVVMPNLSPVRVRNKYLLYDGKICTGEESAQCVACLDARVRSAGYRIVTDRGDVRRDGGSV
ncbi:MAG: [Clostridia bacterium]|nr:[FeFe] hydrogenase H-cluster radical SAM maturase HydE [Clostridia bacterium]